MRKHKKYYGGKDWSETLYFYSLDEGDIEWKKENNEDIGYIKPGDTEFYLLSPPFGNNDFNSCISFDAILHGWEDMNLFITDTEVFNWYKNHRI